MKIKISTSSYEDFKHVAYTINNRNVGTFVMPDAFNGIAKDQKLKTLAELGNSRTNLRDVDATRKLRKDNEERILHGDQSLYGMLVNKKAIQNEFNKADPDYGQICLIWKEVTKRKSVAFLGDSTIHATKIYGRPLLNLHDVSSGQVRDWLAQYGIYPHGKTSYVDVEKGTVVKNVNLSTFDVDANSMRTTIGRGRNLIEVIHKGALSYPFDFQCVVVKNPNWVKIVKQNLMQKYGTLPLNVITTDEYKDGFDI